MALKGYENEADMSQQEVHLFPSYQVIQITHLNFFQKLFQFGHVQLYLGILLQNQVFKFSRCFWKVNGDEQSLLICNPWLETIDFLL